MLKALFNHCLTLASPIQFFGPNEGQGIMAPADSRRPMGPARILQDFRVGTTGI